MNSIVTDPTPAANGGFGWSVAVDGDAALISSLGDLTHGTSRGSAHIFVFAGGQWAHSAKLIAASGMTGGFGYSVGLHGQVAVVGSPYENDVKGAVYVFVQQSVGVWSEEAKIEASDGASLDFFGSSVDLRNGRLLVGAYNQGGDAITNGAGAAYVFDRFGTQWSEVAKLIASDGEAGDMFGSAVALDKSNKDQVIVGSWLDGGGCGSAYVFDQSGGVWTQEIKLLPQDDNCDANSDSYFGWSVAFDADTVIIGDWNGAWLFRRQGVGLGWEGGKIAPTDVDFDVMLMRVDIDGGKAVMGAQLTSDNKITGVAYTFAHTEPPLGTGWIDGWAQSAKLVHGNADSAGANYISFSVALEDDTLFIGTPFDDAQGATFGTVQIYDASLTSQPTPSPTQPQSVLVSLIVLPRFFFDFNAKTHLMHRHIEIVPQSCTLDTKIIPEDGTVDDHFGYSLALSGDTLLVSAPYDDENGMNSGSAYVYVNDGNNWVLEAKLLPDNGSAGDVFGASVALDGDLAIVSAWNNEMPQIHPVNSGSVYVFVRDASTWTQETQLFASDGVDDDGFGYSVALVAETADVATLLIGAPYQRSSVGFNTGSVYVFNRSWTLELGHLWDETMKITAGDADGHDVFGMSVALSMETQTAVVGAIGDDDNGNNSGSVYIFVGSGVWNEEAKITSVDGGVNDSFGWSVALDNNRVVVSSNPEGNGKVYVFERDAGTNQWTQQASLLPDSPLCDDGYGFSVALHNDKVLVGSLAIGLCTSSAFLFTRDATGTWSEQNQFLTPNFNSSFGRSVALDESTVAVSSDTVEGGDNSGSAHVIECSLPTPYPTPLTPSCMHATTIIPDDGNQADHFGYSLALSGDTLLLGAPFDDENGVESGSAYVYVHDGVDWVLQTRLLPSDGSAGDMFGWSVALDGNLAVVSAWNTAPCCNAVQKRGSVYVFLRTDSTWSQENQLFPSDGIQIIDNVRAPESDPLGFGHSVALVAASDSDDTVATVLVGAPYRVTGVGSNTGTVYVFSRTWADGVGGMWSETAKIEPSDSVHHAGYFGWSVALSADTKTAVLGAIGDGFKSLEDDNNGSVYVYVFDENNGAWSEEAKITDGNGMDGDRFGWSVALDNDRVLVSSVPISGGNAYVFERTTGTTQWTHEATLVPETTPCQDNYALTVALQDNRAVVGSFASGLCDGSAFIFTRSDSTGAWSEEMHFSPETFNGNNGWNVAVAVDDSRVVVSSDYVGDVNSGSAHVIECTSSAPPPTPPTSTPALCPGAAKVPNECELDLLIDSLELFVRGDHKLIAQWVRAAFHDAGTFNQVTNEGGANGCLMNHRPMRDEPENSFLHAPLTTLHVSRHCCFLLYVLLQLVSHITSYINHRPLRTFGCLMKPPVLTYLPPICSSSQHSSQQRVNLEHHNVSPLRRERYSRLPSSGDVLTRPSAIQCGRLTCLVS